ncbi:MAG: T9SS type A sorting domain-containing protein [Candidatus Zixiibacteriota bacterium]
MKRLYFSLLIIATLTIFASSWTPPEILAPDHPRILFTASDSADVHDRLSVSPWSSYYSSIWSRANATSGNGSETEDMNRAKIAMSAGFVLYFNVKPSGDTLTIAERDALSSKAIDYLNNVLGFTGSLLSNGDYHYPSERLIMYSVAYDLLEGADYDAPESALSNLADEIYDNATYSLLGIEVDNTVLFANHKLLVAGGLGIAAVAMPENGQSQEWIDYAMTKMNHVTFTEETDPTTISGFAEGPHYLKYSLEHMDMWFLGMKHFIGDATYEYEDPCGGDETASIRCPWYDLRWDKIYLWISSIRLPDGTVPPLDDSFRHEGFCMCAPFAERNPDFYWNTAVGGSRLFIHPMMVAVGADTAGPMPPGLTSLPDAGNLIFRSSFDNGGIYFHYLGEHGIANSTIHNQSDASSFMLHAYGEDLAIDPGYIQYSERGRVNAVEHHNTILVNGGGPGTSTVVDSYIDKAFELNGLYYGEVSTAYSSADINRRSCLLGERFICLIDDLSRGSSAEFTFQCHGWGLESEGNFISDAHGGLWTEGEPAYLRAVVDAPGGIDEFRYENSTHEVSYLDWTDHTVLRADKSGTDTRIIAVLYPFSNETGHDLRYNVHSISGQATIRFGAEGQEGIMMAAISTTELAGGGDALLPSCQGFGESAIFLADSVTGMLRNIYSTDTDSAMYDGDLIFKSSSRRDIALYYESETIVRGYLNDFATTISIPAAFEPTFVEGAVSYDWDGEFVNIQVADYSHFWIDFTPLSVFEEQKETKGHTLTIFPNPGSRKFTIEMENIISYEVYDITGKLVDNSNRLRKSNIISWEPSSGIECGVYLVKAFRASGEYQSSKIYIK